MIANFKSYLNNRLALVKLEMVEAVGKGLSKIIVLMILGILFLFIYCFLMIGFSILIGLKFFPENLAIGFLITALLHFVLFILVLLLRRNFIEKKLLNSFISAAFSNQNDLEDDIYYEDTKS